MLYGTPRDTSGALVRICAKILPCVGYDHTVAGTCARARAERLIAAAHKGRFEHRAIAVGYAAELRHHFLRHPPVRRARLGDEWPGLPPLPGQLRSCLRARHASSTHG